MNRRRFAQTLLLAALVAAPVLAEQAGGISWTAPADWANQARPMRAANYTVPGAGGAEPGELAVYYFGPGQGGSVDANLERWIKQFQAPGGGPADADAKRSQKTVNGIAVTLLDLEGTYLFKPAPMAPQATPKPGYRMLAAIAEGPHAPIFFKMTGPAKTVAAAEKAFHALVDSIKPLS